MIINGDVTMGEHINHHRILSVLIMLTALISCSGKNLQESGRYEGIRGDSLRVYMREDRTDDGTEQGMAQYRAMILEQAKRRGALLIVGHLMVDFPGLTDTAALEKLIAAALEKGSIVSSRCDDDTCETFIDYPVRDTLEEAGKSRGRGQAE